MKNLFVNGCSFLNKRNINKDNMKNPVMSTLIDFSTAECIQDFGGFENMVNLARGGRGNDRIFLTTVAYFESELERKKDTFVMIGWSASQRLDYPTRREFKPMPLLDECWATIKINDNKNTFNNMCRVDMDIIHWAITRYYQNVLGLQNYLKVNKIPYVFYNSLSNFTEDGKKDHKRWLNAVDQTRFFKIDSSQHLWAKENNLLINKKDDHPSAEGHKKWAKELYKYILEKGLTNEV